MYIVHLTIFCVLLVVSFIVNLGLRMIDVRPNPRWYVLNWHPPNFRRNENYCYIIRDDNNNGYNNEKGRY